MESNTKYMMAVFSLMLGLSWGIPYLVSETEERNESWLMLAIFFFVLALVFWLWISREQGSAEEEANNALDAAEDKLKKIEIKAADPEPVPEQKAVEPEPVVEPEPEPVAKVAVEPEPVASGEPDDLTRIEGIGPKSASILNVAGVTTFSQIASMSEDEIVALIKSNGGRKSKSMATWAEQAKFAANGDWDGLAKLQDELSGGSR